MAHGGAEELYRWIERWIRRASRPRAGFVRDRRRLPPHVARSIPGSRPEPAGRGGIRGRRGSAIAHRAPAQRIAAGRTGVAVASSRVGRLTRLGDVAGAQAGYRSGRPPPARPRSRLRRGRVQIDGAAVPQSAARVCPRLQDPGADTPQIDSPDQASRRADASLPAARTRFRLESHFRRDYVPTVRQQAVSSTATSPIGNPRSHFQRGYVPNWKCARAARRCGGGPER